MEDNILKYMTAFNKPPILQGATSDIPIGYGQQNTHMPHQVFPHVNVGYLGPSNIVSGNTNSIGTAGSMLYDKTENANNILYNNAENAGNIIYNKAENTGNIIFNKAENAGNMIYNKSINEGNILHNKAENTGNILYNKRINEGNMLYNKSRNATNSTDEDEPSFLDDCDSGSALDPNQYSPWQRMKWTDSMVKLLMKIVVRMGEEEDSTIDGSKKRKPAFLHKKGKWKSVSQVMNDKGFYVSPQQCEDKFNDLNKRYKKLNDILGNELAWTIANNPHLLDGIDTISSKAKEDVRKILSSKHLFYKEMCLYHKEYRPPCELPSSTTVTQGLKGTDSLEVSSKTTIASADRGDANDLRGKDDNDEHYKNDDDDDDDVETKANIDSGTDVNVSKRRKLSWLNLPSSIFNSVPVHLKILGSDPSLFIKQMMLGCDELNSVDDKQVMLTLLAEERKVWLLAESLRVCKKQFKWQKLNCKKHYNQEQHQLEMIREKLENEKASLQMKIDMDCKRIEASLISNEQLILQ